MATDYPQEVQDGDNTMSEGRLETTIRMKIGTCLQIFIELLSDWNIISVIINYDVIIMYVIIHTGEVKGIPAGAGGKLHDLYVAVLLDQEEVYRTATIEKTLKYGMIDTYIHTYTDR